MPTTVDESRAALYDSILKKEETLSNVETIGKCLFYLWDGVEFFELSGHQLERVKSKKSSWRDKLCSE